MQCIVVKSDEFENSSPLYIFPLNPDYVAARSLRSLRSNNTTPLLLDVGVTNSILIGYKYAANSCLLCFSYIIPTDNSFMHAEVTSPNTLTSSLISFVMAELSSGICIIKQLLDSVFA